MRHPILFVLALLLAVPCAAATVSQNCNATVQGIGACGAGDNGEAGVIIAYWASTVDDAPADPAVSSNAADLRSAICANLGIAEGACTTAAADGALRRLLVEWTKNYRKQKALGALPAQADPVLDGQGNP